MNLMACNNIHPGSFKLDGFIDGAKDAEKIMLYYYSLKNGEWLEIADTTIIRNGKFVFTGHIDELTAAGLVYEEPDHDIAVIDIQLYLEPTAMKLQINKNNPFAYVLTGTKVEKENIELRKELEPYQKVDLENSLYLDDLRNRLLLNYENTLIRDSLNKEYDLHIEKMRIVHSKMYETILDFVSKHKTYRIVPDLLMYFPADTAQAIYNSLPEQSKSGLLGKRAHQRIEYWKSMQEFEENALIGHTAPDFTRQDVYGNTISLSEFKNKNCVLLDFWASWCRPCIANIPQLISVYEQYSKQGLVFIGISIDSDSTRWLNAIETYQLDRWPQILSIQNEKRFTFDNEHLGNIYNASAIPCYILIDKQGKIAARWEGSIDEEQLMELDSIIHSIK
jgi:peroxiredoxin